MPMIRAQRIIDTREAIGQAFATNATDFGSLLATAGLPTNIVRRAVMRLAIEAAKAKP